MLQDCIAAREDLGVLMARRLKDSGPACDCCGDHLADHSGTAGGNRWLSVQASPRVLRAFVFDCSSSGNRIEGYVRKFAGG